MGLLAKTGLGRLGDRLVGLGECRGLDDVGLSAHTVAVAIAGVGEHAVLVTGLGLAPGCHNLDRLTKRILDGAAVTLGRVDAIFSSCFVAVEEFLRRNDVPFTRGVGHDPVPVFGGVDRLGGTAGEDRRDRLTSDRRPSLHAPLFLVNRGFD